jgi:hypothetical protein
VLFTFPSRYLFTIGRQLVFSLTRWSAQIHTRLHLYRVTQEFPRRALVFGYGPFTLYGAIFHSLHLTFALSHRAPTTPAVNRWFGLFRFRSPLLTESYFHFLFLTLLRCFTSGGVARTVLLYSHSGSRAFTQPGYPIRRSTGQSVCAAIRGLSQLVASFIAYWHQGIHRAPFVA